MPSAIQTSLPLIHRCALIAAALVLAGLLICANARADEAPVTLQSLQDDPFTFDPGFWGGRWRPDWFPYGAGDRDFRARRLVRLENGDVIVAGLVPKWGEANAASGSNIGLVRYSASGGHVIWTGGGPYNFIGVYLIYPDSANPSFQQVRDLKVWGDYLYVLTDVLFTASDQDVRVLVFRLDGTFIGGYDAFSRGQHESAGGMEFSSRLITGPGPIIQTETKLYVAGTLRSTGGRRVPTLARFTRNADGSLTRDSNLGVNGNLTYVDYPVPDSYCHSSARPCEALVSGIALTSLFGNNGVRRLYLGASVRYGPKNGGEDWDFLAIAANGSGVLDTSFAGNGYREIRFDQGSSATNTWRDTVLAVQARTISLAPHRDEIFLAGRVAQERNAEFNDNRGVGVVKLADNGNTVDTFGNLGGGRALFGGCSSNCTIGNRLDVETLDMSLNGDRLAIVGAETSEAQLVIGGFGRFVNATLAIVRANGGALTEFTNLRLFEGSPGQRRDSYARSIVPAGPQAFAIAGNGAVGGSSSAYITTRVAPDRIFGNGFAN